MAFYSSAARFWPKTIKMDQKHPLDRTSVPLKLPQKWNFALNSVFDFTETDTCLTIKAKSGLIRINEEFSKEILNSEAKGF